MRTVPVIIVGAGPAGLLAAIGAGSKALVLERNPQAGRKLLLTGSGQCNFTNSLPRENFLQACGKAAAFLKPALYRLGSGEFRALLDKAGCPSLERPDGKVFPQSLRAVDVRDALLRLAESSGARIRYQAKALSVTAADGLVVTDSAGGAYRCSSLILAGGGSSWPRTGSDGSCYQLASALGHSVRPPRPALASVRIRDYEIFRACAGISLPGVEAAFVTAGGKFPARGDLLWTHTGLSGPLILDNSHSLASGDLIRLTLVPRASNRLAEILSLNPRRSLLQALRRFTLPEALLKALLLRSGVDPGQPCDSVTRDTRVRVASLLGGVELFVSSVESLATAMATSGGVPLGEVRARDLSSRVCPGLFFAGEILDYDLPTGGFNLQCAAATGYLAGLSAVSRTLIEKKD